MQQTFGRQPVPPGDAIDQCAVLNDQAAPGFVNRSHVRSVGLFFLPLVFPLGDGVVEEFSSCVGVES